MTFKSLLLMVALSLTLCHGLSASAQNGLLHKLFSSLNKPKAPSKIGYPEAPMPRTYIDGLIPPPGENKYFPMRADKQAFILDIDSSTNLTDALNRFYYNFKWRSQEWAPFDNVTVAEKACRQMNTWGSYQAANQARKLTRFNEFMERWSGYGPE